VTDQQLKQTLRDGGLRVTPQRILIHRALAELGRHSTAEEVLESVAPRLPNASLPTVYATLELLEELGIARRIAASSGAMLWDPRPERHHHLVCRSCGAVEDLDVKVDAANPFRAARRRGFRPDGAELVVSGLCERCQT
jgi:Fur family peroxide stress response transcriptional regulator